MSYHTRRRVLKVSGAVLGGIAAGSTVVAAESADRFVVDTAGLNDLGDLEVVWDLDDVDLAVVRARESAVEATGAPYAPDIEYEIRRPAGGRLERRYEPPKGRRGGESATDEPFYDTYQWDKQALDVPTAHEVTRGAGTRVAVIDTGVAAGHPDLQHAVDTERSRNFTGDPYGAPGPYGGYHGTHVSGIIAADDQNEAGISGMAPATEIVDCRVFSPGELASFSSILAATVHAANVGCDAANMSIGAYPVPRDQIGRFYGMSLNRIFTYATARGTSLVVSAGNDAANLQHDGGGVVYVDVDGDGVEERVVHSAYISLPNEGAQALSISATGPIGYGWGDPGLESPPESPAFYTNYGTNAIDLGAPGGDADPAAIDVVPGWYLDLVFSTIAEPSFTGSGRYRGATYGYGWAAGTSMAAPQVTGAVALVRSQHPDWGPNKVESALKRAADVPAGYDKSYYGGGFLNLVDAL